MDTYYGMSYKLRTGGGGGGGSLLARKLKKNECTLNEPKTSCLHAEIFINGLSVQSERMHFIYMWRLPEALDKADMGDWG